VTPAQLHLTLRFLGMVAEADVSALLALLGRVRAPAFDLALGGVGLFPGGPRQPPRVLWAGVTPVGPVQALKRAIDGVLGPDPEERDRGFSPHVTLARLKDDPGLSGALGTFRDRHRDLASHPFPVRGFRLYQSRTGPGGPEYAVLAEYPLSTP
jgi:2'-5' RNA ligase